jgi:hypothetical protein
MSSDKMAFELGFKQQREEGEQPKQREHSSRKPKSGSPNEK